MFSSQAVITVARPTSARGRREGGSILLVTSVITFSMLLLAGSTLFSIKNRLAMSREESSQLSAELLAESALQYMIKRMNLNSERCQPARPNRFRDLVR